MDKSSVKQRKANTSANLRKELGRYLRKVRESKNLTQGQLADLVGLEYYTSISQIELGRGRLPVGRYASYAKALGLPIRDFTRTMMKHYDPITYSHLFGDGLYDPLLASSAKSENSG